MMNKISDLSCAAYRKIVREDERFVPYFRSATPELELSELNIGSRPAKRKASGGVESLRAIVSEIQRITFYFLFYCTSILTFEYFFLISMNKRSLGYSLGLKLD